MNKIKHNSKQPNRTLLELSFLPLLLNMYSNNVYHVMLLNHNCFRLYAPFFLQQLTWDSKNIRKEWLPFVRKMECTEPMKTKLPSNLSHLYWKNKKLLPLNWPSSLQSLYITEALRQYDFDLLHTQCPHLTTLKVKIDQRCHGFILPTQVTHFELSTDDTKFYQLPNLILPPNLQILFWDIFANIPKNQVSEFIISDKCHDPQQNIASASWLSCHWISAFKYSTMNLVSLHLTGRIYAPLTNLPSTLTTLHITSYFNSPIVLPPLLMILWLPNDFNQPIGFFPFSLRYIRFGSRFNQCIDGLPEGLLELELGLRFRYSLALLPDSITHLHLRCIHYHSPIIRLPNQLQYIKMKDCVLKQLTLLPKKIQTIDIRLCSSLFSLRQCHQKCKLIVNDCKRYSQAIKKKFYVRCIACLHKEYSCDTYTIVVR